jgi:hypothetical protein
MNFSTLKSQTKRQLGCVGMILIWGAGSAAILAHGMIFPRSLEEQNLSALARTYKRRLDIRADIPVVIVKKNERLASVRPYPGRSATYLLEIDESFLATLAEDEKRAIVAHEVGHVWIFTHYPYVQSEALANEKAEGLVQQNSLITLYKKVWALGGQQGTLTQFLNQKLGLFGEEDLSAAAIPALQSEVQQHQ